MPFHLESGEVLTEFQLQYSTWGSLNPSGTNVIWVCHALTGNSNIDDWWPNMIGPGAPLDTDQYFVVCVNMIGSCYGSTGPLSINPINQRPYYHTFPEITTFDMANAQSLLRTHLGIASIHVIVGGSMGGQQALAWATLEPMLFTYLIPIATNAFHSPWGIAFNEAQRMAIEADPSWQDSSPSSGLRGMVAARATAMLSYRHYQSFGDTQSEKTFEKRDEFRASSYQRYQGEKLADRFNAFSYWTLSKAMDSHNLGRKFGGPGSALKRITSKSLVIGIDSDILFPLAEQQYLADHIQRSVLEVVPSSYGHDGFLIETEKIGKLIRDFIHE